MIIGMTSQGRLSVSVPVVHIILLVCITVTAHDPILDKAAEIPGSLIQQLFDLTASEQVQEEVPLQLGKQWHQQEGSYSNVLKDYCPGGLPLPDSYDNNMFVAAWVTSTLLEAFRYGRAPRPSDQQLIKALNFIDKCRDKNVDYDTSVMGFWPMAYNEMSQYWQFMAENAKAEFDTMGVAPFYVMTKVLGMTGLEKLIKYLVPDERATYFHSPVVPADFDDTFANLGLGSLLYQMKDEFPEAWDLWNSQNANITSVFDSLKKYSYRPFSSDRDVNSIDPRTYFILRGFLDDAVEKGEDIALVTTWVQSLGEVQNDDFKGDRMDTFVNNIEITVCANTVFAITASVLTGLVSPDVLDDPELAQIYLNTSSLIAYGISTNFSGRPDLALLYYPSRMEFAWFVSRTVAIMEEARSKQPFPVPVMETVYQTMKEAVLYLTISHVLPNGQPDGAGGIFYDDFLSERATSGYQAVSRAEDRIFTTAMATNALLYSWTTFNDANGTMQWREDVPQMVKDYTKATVTWLVKHTLDGNYDPWNAFFASPNKGFSVSFHVTGTVGVLGLTLHRDNIQ